MAIAILAEFSLRYYRQHYEIVLWFLPITNKKFFCNKPRNSCRCKVFGIKTDKINDFLKGLSSALSEEENKQNEVMN